MNNVEPSFLKPGDDLDGLLRAFFRRQMPHSWPTLPVPRFRVAPATRPTTSGRPLIRSRFALAASVALLLLGSLLLPSRFTRDVNNEQGPNGAFSADRQEQSRMKRAGKAKDIDDQAKPGLGIEDDDPLHELGEFDLPPIE